jgi:quercetin dioxygenase-like cupin family protein
VISGKLEVRVYQDDKVVDVTTLGPWQVTDVPPGTRHEFAAVEDTTAVELYWVTLDAQDIDRHGTIGGKIE